MTYYVTAVRYGLMNETENMVSESGDLHPGDTVIIKTERGVEYGEVTKTPTALDHEAKGLGEIMRVATESDMNIINHIQDQKEPEESSYCQSCIEERELPMKLAGIEHLFSGDKIIFYFLADRRVDFRELVKDLARRYRTRIEMRQIGVRDEARLLSDFEHCGRELCCRTFIRKLEPVTMRMAKMQKSTLDPSKISGHCGRLMCCLRYEDEVYSTHKKELPNKNEIVGTDEVEGRVLSTNLLSRDILIETRQGDRLTINLNDVTIRKGKQNQRQGGGGCCKDKKCKQDKPQNRRDNSKSQNNKPDDATKQDNSTKKDSADNDTHEST